MFCGSFPQSEHSMPPRKGTIVDATIVSAASLTKNSAGERDPEMHQTRKGNQWYFGMKAHVGVDAESGLVHTMIGTAANVADVTQAHDLLHGEETVAFGDAVYTSVAKRPDRKQAVDWHVAMKPGKRRALGKTQLHRLKRIERLKAQVRARGEHAFRVVKRQFGYVKVRYRGLAENTAQLHVLFALANVWMVRSISGSRSAQAYCDRRDVAQVMRTPEKAWSMLALLLPAAIHASRKAAGDHRDYWRRKIARKMLWRLRSSPFRRKVVEALDSRSITHPSWRHRHLRRGMFSQR
jgi:IS5 family transposase